jgi:hypothetical protein
MSDDLDRAVDARIDAYRPDTLPPFEAIEGRKRSRDRRRTTTGAAALSVITVAGIVVVPSVLSGGQDRLPSYADPSPPQAAAQDLADRLCADAARQYDGEVAAAYAITVQDVRDYFPDSNGVGGDPSAGPDSRVVVYPTGWDQTSLTDPAAACYIDASFPAPAVPGAVNPERALIMTAEGATAFIATAGSKESLPLRPLGGKQDDPAPGEAVGQQTFYTVQYDDAAAFQRHEQALEACFALPGLDVRSRFSMPPRTSVTVTGADEDNAFRECMQPLDGVLLVQVGDWVDRPDFTVEPVQEGFRNLNDGFAEQAGDGPLRFVDFFRNEGAAARSATFVLTLREKDGRTVWVGRATATDLEPGEEFQVTYEGTEPAPGGDQYRQWRVEDVLR